MASQTTLLSQEPRERAADAIELTGTFVINLEGEAGEREVSAELSEARGSSPARRRPCVLRKPGSGSVLLKQRSGVTSGTRGRARKGLVTRFLSASSCHCARGRPPRVSLWRPVPQRRLPVPGPKPCSVILGRRGVSRGSLPRWWLLSTCLAGSRLPDSFCFVEMEAEPHADTWGKCCCPFPYPPRRPRAVAGRVGGVRWSARPGSSCWLPPLAAASASLRAVTTTYPYCVVAARGLRALTEEEVLWRVGTVSLGPFSRSEGRAADRNQTRSGRAGPSAPGGTR